MRGEEEPGDDRGERGRDKRDDWLLDEEAETAEREAREEDPPEGMLVQCEEAWIPWEGDRGCDCYCKVCREESCRNGWLAAEDEDDECCRENIRAYSRKADPEGVVQRDVHVLARIAFRPVKLVEHVRWEGEGDEAHAENSDEHARQKLNRAEGERDVNPPPHGCQSDGEDVDEHGQRHAENGDAERRELS